MGRVSRKRRLPPHELRSLEGRRVVVTGGTSGIGRAAALRFLDLGATVVVGARGDAEAQLQRFDTSCKNQTGAEHPANILLRRCIFRSEDSEHAFRRSRRGGARCSQTGPRRTRSAFRSFRSNAASRRAPRSVSAGSKFVPMFTS